MIQELLQMNREVVQQNQDLVQVNQEIVQQTKTLLQKIEIPDKINSVINKGNEFISSMPSIDDFYTILNSYINFLTSFDPTQQIVIANLICTLYFVSLFVSYLGALYANYLINKFDLSNRLPRLAKILHYRMKYQQFYFKYLAALTILGFFLSIGFNIFILYISIL